LGLESGRPDGKKLGLALGSGVARGLAHIGVLGVLEKEGITVDMIAGTSIGALIGALYAQGRTIGEITDIARELGSNRLSYLLDLNLPKTGLLRGRRIEDGLKKFFGNMEFGDLKMPFACVATDIDTGEEVVIDKGPLWQAIRASVSIPVVLAVAKWEDRYLVDGGLVNPVPVNILKEMGADRIVAVNVIPDRSVREATEPNIFDVIMQTLHIVGYYAVKSSIEEADIVIEPEVAQFALTDFHLVDEFARQGELAARGVMPEIKTLARG
jgi:NTE family protein